MSLVSVFVGLGLVLAGVVVLVRRRSLAPAGVIALVLVVAIGLGGTPVAGASTGGADDCSPRDRTASAEPPGALARPARHEPLAGRAGLEVANALLMNPNGSARVRELTATWDDGLVPAMRADGRRIFEEQVLALLVDDLGG